MVSHSTIWQAIDDTARRHGLTPSGLARLAGLDSTAFNKSKRVSKEGRERWPSTESLAKVADATGEDFASILSGGGIYEQFANGFGRLERSVPLLGFAQAGAGGYFDSGGFPAGQGWDEVRLPNASEPGTYALEVTGDSMLPLYRDGDRLIVSATEQVRRGDRVVVRTVDGEVMAKVLHRQTAKQVELHSLNPEHKPRTLSVKDIDWIARILWASQ